MLTKLFVGLLAATMSTAFPATNMETAFTAPAKANVLVDLFYSDNCNGKPTYARIEADKCYDFSAGVKSLRVAGVEGQVKYNACK